MAVRSKVNDVLMVTNCVLHSVEPVLHVSCLTWIFRVIFTCNFFTRVLKFLMDSLSVTILRTFLISFLHVEIFTWTKFYTCRGNKKKFFDGMSYYSNCYFTYVVILCSSRGIECHVISTALRN